MPTLIVYSLSLIVIETWEANILKRTANESSHFVSNYHRHIILLYMSMPITVCQFERAKVNFVNFFLTLFYLNNKICKYRKKQKIVLK